MKNIRSLTIALGVATALPTLAQLNIPSDGSDGALVITTNTVIDLSLASYGAWNQSNSTNAGNGIYDPAKWAVVFKYSSVYITNGAMVSFLNHPTHAPVVWLVQSNADIQGSISLDGSYIQLNYPDYLTPTEPGPGGFRGGAFGPSGIGGGYGPGGAQASEPSYAGAYGGSYGNPQVIPLMGGSGAGADQNNYYSQSPIVPFGGASGGGAILIAAGGTVQIDGGISAEGAGFAGAYYPNTTDHSGAGAIRIVANSIQGSGDAAAGTVRTEANSISSQLVLTPNTVAVSPGATPVIWPPASAPAVVVVSINGVSAPSDPVAGVGTSSDVNISTNNPVNIVLQSLNFPPSGSIVVRVTPKYANYFTVNATYQSGDFNSATWIANTTLPNGFCVLQAHATSP